MKISIAFVATIAACCWSHRVAAQGFGGLLDPLTSVLGSVTSPFGPINIVGSPAVDVDTRIGSPSTVLDTTPEAPKGGGGINLVTPSFVRVKTDVDSEKTEVRTTPTGGNHASPTPPAFGGITLVGSPIIDVGTNVGSPSTVIGSKPSSGLNIVTPSFVRVKTNVDSENTAIYKPASVRADRATTTSSSIDTVDQ